LVCHPVSQVKNDRSL